MRELRDTTSPLTSRPPSSLTNDPVHATVGKIVRGCKFLARGNQQILDLAYDPPRAEETFSARPTGAVRSTYVSGPKVHTNLKFYRGSFPPSSATAPSMTAGPGSTLARRRASLQEARCPVQPPATRDSSSCSQFGLRRRRVPADNSEEHTSRTSTENPFSHKASILTTAIPCETR